MDRSFEQIPFQKTAWETKDWGSDPFASSTATAAVRVVCDSDPLCADSCREPWQPTWAEIVYIGHSQSLYTMARGYRLLNLDVRLEAPVPGSRLQRLAQRVHQFAKPWQSAAYPARMSSRRRKFGKAKFSQNLLIKSRAAFG